MTSDELENLLDSEEWFTYLVIHTLMDQRTQAVFDKQLDIVELITKELSLVILSTMRFGVDDLISSETGHVKPSPKYLQWYNHWHGWFLSINDSETWSEFIHRVENKKDISRLLPNGPVAEWQTRQT